MLGEERTKNYALREEMLLEARGGCLARVSRRHSCPSGPGGLRVPIHDHGSRPQKVLLSKWGTLSLSPTRKTYPKEERQTQRKGKMQPLPAVEASGPFGLPWFPQA